MRSFIGIDFNREFKDQIASVQSTLRAYSTKGRWKYIDNFHLTLKFLGEIDLEQVEGISRAMDVICHRTHKFSLTANQLGNFPGRGSLRVLWLGLGGDIAELSSLQENIDSELDKLGFESEKRKFTPHITIGQEIVFTKGFEDIEKLVDIEALPQIFVDKVLLYKSEQIGSKRVYSSIYECSLR